MVATAPGISTTPLANCSVGEAGGTKEKDANR